MKIVINLSPCDIKKSGSHFDLGMAIGLLIQSNQIKVDDLSTFGFIGELSLNADLRPSTGVLSMVIEAKKRGINNLIVPKENLMEASLVNAINIFAFKDLKEVVDFLEGTNIYNNTEEFKDGHAIKRKYFVDFEDVQGQDETIEFIMIGAAGGHNILLSGSPGCGKSMIAKRIASEAAIYLAANNIPVISGMAKGIDGYAHTACVNAGGYTIAFLGCGIDISYRKEHLRLMEKIKETGALISEYPPKTKPDALNFPKRNRLISAFSKKLLVVEASENSGSLITAEFARNYGRKVFSTPNSIFSNESKGSNKLILHGATIYISPEQLLDELIDIGTKNKEYDDTIQINTYNKIDNIEKMILNAINKEPKNIDELKNIVNNNGVDILEKLSLMELDEVTLIKPDKVLNYFKKEYKHKLYQKFVENKIKQQKEENLNNQCGGYL